MRDWNLNVMVLGLTQLDLLPWKARISLKVVIFQQRDSHLGVLHRPLTPGNMQMTELYEHCSIASVVEARLVKQVCVGG